MKEYSLKKRDRGERDRGERERQRGERETEERETLFFLLYSLFSVSFYYLSVNIFYTGTQCKLPFFRYNCVILSK